MFVRSRQGYWPRVILAGCCALTLVSAAAPAWGQSADVEVTITADNAYGFGWGTGDAMASYFGGVENRLAGEIFNCPLGNGPERYTIPGATVDDYLYIVAWSDDVVTQGVIGQFRVAGGETFYTGAGDWQVYATGLNFDSYSGGPPLDGSADAINAQIALANQNSGAPASSSGGWVDTVDGRGANAGSGLGRLAFGEDNRDRGGDFPRVCPSEIDDDARWMWFSRDGVTSAFRNGNHKEYLIFRLPLRDVVASPAATPTASPTPRPTATPAPIYLPILLRERCDETRGFVDVGLVLDASTTMRDPAADGRPKIQVAVAAVHGFLDGLRLRPGGDRVALVTFNARGEMLQALTDDRAALDRALEQVVVREQSRIDLGLVEAVRAMGAPQAGRSRALIVLTDGLSNPVPGSIAVEAAARAKAEGLRLHVIGIGARRDEATLRGIASDEKTYHDAPSPDVWLEIYERLAGRLRCPPADFWGRR